MSPFLLPILFYPCPQVADCSFILKNVISERHCHRVLRYQLHTGAEAHALILVGCRVLTLPRLTTPCFAYFLDNH